MGVASASESRCIKLYEVTTLCVRGEVFCNAIFIKYRRPRWQENGNRGDLGRSGVVESWYNIHEEKSRTVTCRDSMPEVSRVHSTPPVGGGRSKPSILNPHYVAGFVDGEGCFCVSVSKHKTLRRRLEVRPEFAIEVRADDRAILERIQATLECGTIYDLSYDRYGWRPHAKYKVSNVKDLITLIIPFFDQHQLQAKKAESFRIFKIVVEMVARKEHLTYVGFQRILKLKTRMNAFSKKGLGTARVRENRSPGGVRQKKP